MRRLDVFDGAGEFVHEGSQFVLGCLHGTVKLPCRTVSLPPGTASLPGGTVPLPSGTVSLPCRTVSLPNGAASLPGGTIPLPYGTVSLPGGTVSLPPGTVFHLCFMAAGGRFWPAQGSILSFGAGEVVHAGLIRATMPSRRGRLGRFRGGRTAINRHAMNCAP